VKRTNGDGTFSFLWKETGGPPVLAPNRKGFGSTILLDGAKQFASHAALNYEPDGLRYELRPARRLATYSLAGDAFDYTTQFRALLGDIAEVLGHDLENDLQMPPYEMREDFVEGTLRFGSTRFGSTMNIRSATLR
jgi:hypothetical protein